MAVTVVSPIELVRTRVQSAEGRQGLRHVVEGVVGRVGVDGFGSLWRGLPLMLWRDLPFSGMLPTGMSYWYRPV